MVNTKDIPPEAILLGVYLELQNGQLFFQHEVTCVCKSPEESREGCLFTSVKCSHTSAGAHSQSRPKHREAVKTKQMNFYIT